MLITGMAVASPVSAVQHTRDVSDKVAPDWQVMPGEAERMPPSPLKDAFEIISHCLLYNEEFGVRVTAARLSIEEQVEIDPDHAIGEAVRTGLVRMGEDFLGRKVLRRGPRNAEVLGRMYGREGPPTVESIRADLREQRRARGAMEARRRALREAGRPREHNTAASLPAWVP